MKTWSRLAGFGALAVAAAMGQASDLCPVRGEISLPPQGMGLLTVELSDSRGGLSGTALVSADGTFEVRPAQPGPSDLRVTGPDGSILYQTRLTVGGCGQVLSIRLPESAGSSSPAGGGTVSLQQLAHKVPSQARKAFDKGEQAERKGDHQQAAEWFRQAVAIDPKFADAFNDLGAAEAAQGDLPHAIEDFQSAIEVEPQHRLALPNLSIVLAKAQRFAEAADIARRALRAVPGSGVIHFVLAVSLLSVKGDSDEVVDHLERSASEVPRAHLIVAELLGKRGRRDEAIRHVEDYLRVTPSDDKQRPRAEALLTQLRQ